MFGKEKKGAVRGVGSRISKRQLLHIGVARSKIEEQKKVNEAVASFEDRIISRVESRLDNFEGMIMSLVSKLSNVSTTPLVTTPSSDIGSNSVNRPTHLVQNLNNVFVTRSIQHSPYSIPKTPI